MASLSMHPPPSPSFSAVSSLSRDSLLSEDRSSTAGRTINEHPLFYLPDESATFRVEDTHFRLPTYFFKRDSPVFREQLQGFATFGSGGIGLDTIKLSGVTVTDFERFVRVLYPTVIGKYDAATVEEWTSVLTLADRWKFASIRELAVKEISAIGTPVDRVIVGEKFNEEKMVFAALCELCVRNQPLTREEGEKLGMEKVIKIATARDRSAQDSKSKSTAEVVSEIMGKSSRISGAGNWWSALTAGEQAITPVPPRKPGEDIVTSGSVEPAKDTPRKPGEDIVASGSVEPAKDTPTQERGMEPAATRLGGKKRSSAAGGWLKKTGTDVREVPSQ
ncbi:hypothetical protein AX16_005414 [Volvariella volvacea WC 439]|nr:hypothetical protein AX16_005414 [Volvariella volvacea WC 439]